MNVDRYQRLKTVFAAARRVEGAERETLLARECAGDSDLRREVEELLFADVGGSALLADVVRIPGMPRPESLAGGALERLATPEGAGLDLDPQIELGEPEEKRDPAPSSALIERLRDQGPRAARYRMLGEIARGGMGAVLRVRDDDLRRTLAMKVVLGRDEASRGETPAVDPKMLGRFLEEAQITGQLDHPGIVPIHELGLDANGRVYFTMRLVKGRDLRAVLDLVRDGKDEWSKTRALGVLLRVCEAMAFAHSKGVIHRDLKPANVMVGDFGEVYVMDWGLARVLAREDRHDLRLRPEPSPPVSSVHTERRDVRDDTPDSPLVTMDGDVVGTPSYMAPEQARGELERLGPHSDVYAAGAILYQVLTDEMPYVLRGVRVSPYTVLLAVTEGPPKSVAAIAPDTPPELIAICDKAMAREIPERYADMNALAHDLRAYLEHRVVGAYETGAWAEAKKWVERNRALAASLAAAAGILVTAAAVVAYVQTEGRRKAEQLTDQARASETRAVAESQRANDTAELAIQREREAQWTAYVASMRAAKTSFDAGDWANVRRYLDRAPKEHRGFEWKYLDAESDNSVQVIVPPQGEQVEALIGGEWPRMLTWAQHGCAHISDLFTGVELAQLEIDSTSFWGWQQFSRDGTKVWASTYDGSVRVWDTSSGRVIADWPLPHAWLMTVADSGLQAVVGAHVDEDAATRDAWLIQFGAPAQRLASASAIVGVLGSAAFAPNGERVAIFTASNAVQEFDTKTGRSIGSLQIGPIEGGGLRYSPDGDLLLVGRGGDQATPLWWVAGRDSMTHVLVLRVSGWFGDAAFSPDSDMLAASGADGVCRVLSSRSGELLRELRGHTDGIRSVAFNSQGDQVLTTSRDATARVWNLHSGTSAVLHGHGSRISARFVGEQVVATSDDGLVRVFDARPTPVFETDSKDVTRSPVAWSGEQVVMLATNNKLEGVSALVVFDTDRPAAMTTIRASSYVSARYSQDRTRLFLVEEIAGYFVSVLDVPSYEVLAQSPYCSEDATFAVSADGASLLVDDGEVGAVRVLDALSMEVRSSLPVRLSDLALCRRFGQQVFQMPRQGQYGDAWSFDAGGSRKVETENSESPVVVWDTDTGKRLLNLRGHRGNATACEFLPDASRIVTAGDEGTVRIVDAASGEEMFVLQGNGDAIWACIVSPDGSSILLRGEQWSLLDTVPYAEHYDTRQRMEASEPAARRTVTRLAMELGDWVQVSAALRNDSTLDAATRRMAFNLVTQQAAVDRDAAYNWVRKARRGGATPEQVLTKIRADTSMSPLVRSSAERQVTVWKQQRRLDAR